MRRLFSVGLYIAAGFLIYTVALLAFVKAPSPGMKWVLIAAFAIPAVLALVAAAATVRFQNWKKNFGTVFLSAAGVTASVVFTFACLLINEEFRRMMQPNVLAFFSDYAMGTGAIAALTTTGTYLFRSQMTKP
jgi:hypothetical protein